MDLSGVSTLLEKTRQEADTYSKQDETQPLLKKALGIAICRCDRAFELVKKCIDSGCIKRDHRVNIPKRALTIAGDVSKKMESGEPVNEDATKEATLRFDKASKKLSEFVCQEHQWLSTEFDDFDHLKLHEDLWEQPETKVWWLGTFGNVKVVQWNTFWKGFSEYMDTVYGYPILKCEFNTEIETGIKTCLQKVVLKKDGDAIAWQELDDTAISAQNFQKFYQRFGPWKTLYTKSLTLIDFYEGHPDEIFYPTISRNEGLTFLKGVGNKREKTKKFVIRYSGKMAGALVYQGFTEDKKPKPLNILIANTPTGYSVETDNGSFTNMRDVPAALKIGWGMKFDDQSSSKVWRSQLRSLGINAPAYGKLETAPEDEHFVFVKTKHNEAGSAYQKHSGAGLYGKAPDQKSEDDDEYEGGGLMADAAQGPDYRNIAEDAAAAGDEPAGENKAGDEGGDSIPVGGVPHEPVVAGNKEEAKADEAKADEAKADADKAGEDKPAEEKPDEEKPDEEKPAEKKPDGDKPDGDKPDGDKPDGDKLDGDKLAEAPVEIQEENDEVKNEKEKLDLILTVKRLKAEGLKNARVFIQITPYADDGNPLAMKQTGNKKSKEPQWDDIKLWQPKCLIDFIQFRVCEHSYLSANKPLYKCNLPVKDTFIKDGKFTFKDTVELTNNDNEPAGRLTIQADCVKRDGMK